MKFEVQRRDDEAITILHLKGHLDAHTAPEFEQALEHLLREKRYRVVVDLQELQYISSAGMGVFMGVIEEIRENGGDIKICNASPRVFKVFDLLGFPSLFEFYNSLDEAVKKFKTGQESS